MVGNVGVSGEGYVFHREVVRVTLIFCGGGTMHVGGCLLVQAEGSAGCDQILLGVPGVEELQKGFLATGRQEASFDRVVGTAVAELAWGVFLDYRNIAVLRGVRFGVFWGL